MAKLLSTSEEIENHVHGFSLDDVNMSLLEDSPFQPKEDENIKALKVKFYDHLATVLELDIKEPEQKEALEDKAALLYRAYGGELRFFERFLIARKRQVDKSSVMIKEMLELRKKILGENLVSNATLMNDFHDPGSEAEKDLFAKIDKHWAIDFYGFSNKRNVLMTGKLKNIKPSVFISDFKKEDIKKYYFHFMERGSILSRFSNSSPLSKENEDFRSKRVIEIYDFGGMSMKQFHLSGLMVLKDVLGIGQICFPEHIERSFFINTPWFFSASWKLVSKVLDKDTAAKAVIANHDCKDQLKELLGNEEMLPSLWTRVERKTKEL